MTIQEKLACHNRRSIAYWNLREAGFDNIEAETFIGDRVHWFS